MAENETPWGSWEVLLDTPAYKVKRISVKPNHRLSYQKHAQRREHWFVVQGEAKVTLDGEILSLSRDESVDIKVGTAHRVANESNSDLIFIEVQTGTYFGEDDIERLEDDYGRST